MNGEDVIVKGAESTECWKCVGPNGLVLDVNKENNQVVRILNPAAGIEVDLKAQSSSCKKPPGGSVWPTEALARLTTAELVIEGEHVFHVGLRFLIRGTPPYWSTAPGPALYAASTFGRLP